MAVLALEINFVLELAREASCFNAVTVDQNVALRIAGQAKEVCFISVHFRGTDVNTLNEP